MAKVSSGTVDDQRTVVAYRGTAKHEVPFETLSGTAPLNGRQEDVAMPFTPGRIGDLGDNKFESFT